MNWMIFWFALIGTIAGRTVYDAVASLRARRRHRKAVKSWAELLGKHRKVEIWVTDPDELRHWFGKDYDR